MHDEAYDQLVAATAAGWYVGKLSLHDERGEWVMYPFDPSERAHVGLRSREWTAVAQTEEGVILEMARCDVAFS